MAPDSHFRPHPTSASKGNPSTRFLLEPGHEPFPSQELAHFQVFARSSQMEHIRNAGGIQRYGCGSKPFNPLTKSFFFFFKCLGNTTFCAVYFERESGRVLTHPPYSNWVVRAEAFQRAKISCQAEPGGLRISFWSCPLSQFGNGSKSNKGGYAGFGPCFHLPGFHSCFRFFELCFGPTPILKGGIFSLQEKNPGKPPNATRQNKKKPRALPTRVLGHAFSHGFRGFCLA